MLLSFLNGKFGEQVAKYVQGIFQIKYQKFTTEALADAFIGGLSFDVNPLFRACERVIQFIYDGIVDISSAMKDALDAAGMLPLRFTFPGTKITIELITAAKVVPNFKITFPSVNPLLVTYKFQLLNEWWVMYPVFGDPEIPGTEIFMYTINGVYAQGTSHPEDPNHRIGIDDLLVDGIIFYMLYQVYKFFSALGMHKTAAAVTGRALSLQTSMGMKTQIDDIEDKLDDPASGLTALSSKLSSIIASEDIMEDQLLELLSLANEIRERVGVRLSLAK